MPCRIRKKREWTHRLILEESQHAVSAFATLTYDDENLPENGSLVQEHYRLFLKRLRERISPQRIRFYAVGEYGDKTGRPHYHLALFGFRSCLYGRSRYSVRRTSCCSRCDLVRDTWKLGNIDLGELNKDSAQYIVGYTTKKMTNPEDKKTKEFLNGREPEFGRMSTKPGIGLFAIDDLAHVLMDYRDQMTDVPASLRIGKKFYPLGRYLRDALRVRLGFEKGLPQEKREEIQAELQAMREEYFGSPAFIPGFATEYIRSKKVMEFAPKVDRIERLQRYYSKGKKL